jgi:hypothetical protein
MHSPSGEEKEPNKGKKRQIQGGLGGFGFMRKKKAEHKQGRGAHGWLSSRGDGLSRS